MPFVQGSKAEKDLRPALNKLAETLIGDTFFINIDPSSNQHALDFFGVKKEDTPAFIIQNGKDKYVASNVVSKKLQGFWDSFKVLPFHCATHNASSPPKRSASLYGCPIIIADGTADRARQMLAMQCLKTV